MDTNQYTKFSLICIVLCLTACKQKDIAGRTGDATADLGYVQPKYKKIQDVADILNAPILEIPDLGQIADWKSETRIPGVQLQLPKAFQSPPKTMNQVGTSSQRKLKTESHMFNVGEVRIIFTIWKDIQLDEYIRHRYNSGAMYRSAVIDVRRLTKPRQGYFIVQEMFDDHVMEFVLEGGNNTYNFYAVRPRKGFEREPGKIQISDDEMFKILYSLKLPLK